LRLRSSRRSPASPATAISTPRCSRPVFSMRRSLPR
jgi:hypothetical protein